MCFSASPSGQSSDNFVRCFEDRDRGITLFNSHGLGRRTVRARDIDISGSLRAAYRAHMLDMRVPRRQPPTTTVGTRIAHFADADAITI